MFSGFDLTAVYEPDSNGDIQAVQEGKTPALGTVVFDRGKWYKFVKYAEGTGALDLASGDVVYYVDDTGYSAHTVSADVSDAAGQEIGAGVAQAAVTVTASYFWVQIKGGATIAVAIGGSAGDGDPLTCVGAADKALTKAAESDTAAVYKPVVAFAIDASAKEIYCDFPW
jgi:hypothetical protein